MHSRLRRHRPSVRRCRGGAGHHCIQALVGQIADDQGQARSRDVGLFRRRWPPARRPARPEHPGRSRRLRSPWGSRDVGGVEAAAEADLDRAPTSTRARRSSSKPTARTASKNVAVRPNGCSAERCRFDGEHVVDGPLNAAPSTGTPLMASAPPAHQVRRRVAAGAQPGGAQRALDHRGDRSLAVGAGDENVGNARSGWPSAAPARERGCSRAPARCRSARGAGRKPATCRSARSDGRRRRVGFGHAAAAGAGAVQEQAEQACRASPSSRGDRRRDRACRARAGTRCAGSPRAASGGSSAR